MTSRARTRTTGAVVAAVALAIGVIVLAVRSEDPETPAAAPDTSQLTEAVATAVDGLIWVHGGLVGPAEDSPPFSALLPPGWTPNRTVSAYDVDGMLVHRVTLPPLDGALKFGSLVAIDSHRYLIANRCRTVGGCATEIDNALFRVDGSAAVEIPLSLPQTDIDADVVGAGLLTPLGVAGSGLWALQDLGLREGLPVAEDGQRLLRIDLESGVGEVIELPRGLYGSGSVCLAGDELIATSADVADAQTLASVDILRRPARGGSAPWESVVTLDGDSMRVSGGSVQCLEPSSEVLLTLQTYPTALYAVDLDTGVVREPATPDQEASPRYLGRVDEAEVYSTVRWEFVRRGPDGDFVPTPATLLREAQPLVVGSDLYDVGALVEWVDPRGGPTRVDL